MAGGGTCNTNTQSKYNYLATLLAPVLVKICCCHGCQEPFFARDWK
jgi:hypothetical protein